MFKGFKFDLPVTGLENELSTALKLKCVTTTVFCTAQFSIRMNENVTTGFTLISESGEDSLTESC